MNSFTPKGMSPELTHLIDNEKYLGRDGALLYALKQYFEKNIRKDAVENLIVLANVFYSAAANMWAKAGIYKPLTPLFLFIAKWCIVRAFKEEATRSHLCNSISIVHMRLLNRVPCSIDFGGVQILQSCLVRWIQLKRKLHLVTTDESTVAQRCAGILAMMYVPRTLQVLSSATMMEYYEKNSQDWLTHKDRVFDFYKAYSDEVIGGEADRATVQTFIRIARVLEEYELAKRVASHYNLKDQVRKSK